ncbi:acyl-CoA carboxylase subunit epsilon [Streptomyces sp. NPDC007205]|uniref:acyl-CoA carboxylase subunit epsilon n=1 Tax=Streptomyces sp. NPDC007205 TaxID=3154316 RepID=UPI0033D0A1FE
MSGTLVHPTCRRSGWDARVVRGCPSEEEIAALLVVLIISCRPGGAAASHAVQRAQWPRRWTPFEPRTSWRAAPDLPSARFKQHSMRVFTKAHRYRNYI